MREGGSKERRGLVWAPVVGAHVWLEAKVSFDSFESNFLGEIGRDCMRLIFVASGI